MALFINRDEYQSTELQQRIATDLQERRQDLNNLESDSKNYKSSSKARYIILVGILIILLGIGYLTIRGQIS